MNFIALDFETATGEANSACEIGICVVEEGEVVKTLSYLIKPPSFPYFSPGTIRVHGILPQDVVDSPTLEELWPEIEEYFYHSTVFAHNARFDIRVLRSTLAHHSIFWPKLQYCCSVHLAKTAWKALPKYNLASLAEKNKIVFTHHRAGDDAKACAIIVLNAFQAIGGAFPDIAFDEYVGKHAKKM